MYSYHLRWDYFGVWKIARSRCDLVAQDETSGAKIIIENQLEATNHDHLGKIITYASGLEETVVIWIVKEAREEHRSAIEWLNGKTTEDVSFFLIEIHAYKIRIHYQHQNLKLLKNLMISSKQQKEI